MIKYTEHHHIIDSTMNLAERYIKEQKYDDHFLIIADEQTNARGRKENKWLSDIGCLWFNLVLSHISRQKSFTSFIGVCILKTLLELTDNHSFKIKWPNDIYLFDKKIGGLICTQFTKYKKTSIGIGINTNNEKPLLETADSIRNTLTKNINNYIYLHKIIHSVFDNLSIFEESGITIFSDIIKEHDYLHKKQIKVITGNNTYQGQYIGLNNDGELLLLDNQNIVNTIYSGSVTIVK